MLSRRSGDEASDLPARSRFGKGRAETFYGSTSVFQCLKEIPFARRPITHNSKRPHSEAEGPDRLLRIVSTLHHDYDTVSKGEEGEPACPALGRDRGR